MEEDARMRERMDELGQLRRLQRQTGEGRDGEEDGMKREGKQEGLRNEKK